MDKARHSMGQPMSPPLPAIVEDAWLHQMTELTAQLQKLYASPLLAHDKIAQAIFRDLALSPNMEEIARQCDLLLIRTYELLEGGASSPDFIDETPTKPARAARVMLKL